MFSIDSDFLINDYQRFINDLDYFLSKGIIV